MTRPPRRKARWNGRLRQETPTPPGPLPEPPAYLGTWRWRQPGPLERTEDWFERTERQRAAVITKAASWLRLGQRVKVHLDPRLGGGDVAGRVGIIYRLSSPLFADWASVQFPPRGREPGPRVRMLPLEILQPVK